MRAHRSLTPEDVLKHGRSKVALMVASEFWRAKEGSKYSKDVSLCYDRARELMGVLETCDLGEATAAYLKPYYYECRERDLLLQEPLVPLAVEKFSTRLAEAFEQAAHQLSKGSNHA
jgi:hypothetical protein